MAHLNDWEQKTLRDLLFETLKEQRRKRRWNIFFKFFYIILGLFFILWLASPDDSNFSLGKPHTAVIDIRGIIDDNSQASAKNVIDALKDAFKEPNAKGIILRINSPGGSPVQASYIYNEVMRQKYLHPKKPIYAVCVDLCTSAAYYIASSTDAIYANPSSLVGSIGALIDGFGFVGAEQKLGIERRLVTAGKSKGFLDPFSPLKKEDEAYAHEMLDQIHEQFIIDVKRGRGKRLKEGDDIFSGRVWTGIGAQPLGLIDGFGSTESVARDIIKAKTMVNYTVKENYFEQFANRFGAFCNQTIHDQMAMKLR